MKRYRLTPPRTVPKDRTGVRLRHERPDPTLPGRPRTPARRPEARPEATTTGWHWHVDEASFFRGTGSVAGWATGPSGPLTEVAVLAADGSVLARTGDLRASPDVEAVWGPGAACCRFHLTFAAEDPGSVRDVRLRFSSGPGPGFVASGLVLPAMHADPYHALLQAFLAELRRRPAGTVVEIGSRNRSGTVRRSLVEPHGYLGVDIEPGDNVDLVADAHGLSAVVAPGSCSAALSVSTFEHLAMPWKAVIELNHVLATGAPVFVSSHQTFPMHETPWDFWRFSDSAWRALFNEATGFEVLDTALGERASIVAHLLHPVTTTLEHQPAYLGSAVLARKIGGTDLRWDVPTEVATLGTAYPRSISADGVGVHERGRIERRAGDDLPGPTDLGEAPPPPAGRQAQLGLAAGHAVADGADPAVQVAGRGQDPAGVVHGGGEVGMANRAP